MLSSFWGSIFSEHFLQNCLYGFIRVFISQSLTTDEEKHLCMCEWFVIVVSSSVLGELETGEGVLCLLPIVSFITYAKLAIFIRIM